MVPRFFENSAYASNGCAVLVGGPVREVDAKHIHSCLEELLKYFI